MSVWQSIETAPQNDERILVIGGTWVKGDGRAIIQTLPSLVVWDGDGWLVCDNDGPRSIIRNPKLWAPLPVVSEPSPWG
jgi:hypothetical protein